MSRTVSVESSLSVLFSVDPQAPQVRPAVRVDFTSQLGSVGGGLAGQTQLQFAPYSDEVRNFLLLYPKGALTMSVLWAGTTEVSIPTLFVTTDNGYEIVDDVATHLAVTNPTTGLYLHCTGGDDEDLGIYPGGEDTSITTIADTEWS